MLACAGKAVHQRPREDGMASLSIRKLDEKTYLRLRERAARHGVSMEEEARQILIRATSPP